MAEIDRLDITIATSVKDAKAQITQLQNELREMQNTLKQIKSGNAFKTTGKSANNMTSNVRRQTRQMVDEYKKAATTMTTIRDKMANKVFNIPDTANGAKQALERYQKVYATARDKVLAAQAHGDNRGKVYRDQVEQMYNAAKGISAARKALNEISVKRESYERLMEEQRAAKEAARSIEDVAQSYADVSASARDASYNVKYVNRSLLEQAKNSRVAASPYIKTGKLNFGDDQAVSSFAKIRESMANMVMDIRSKAGEMKSVIAQSFDNMKSKVTDFKVAMREKAVDKGILTYTQDFVTLQKSIQRARAELASLTQAMQDYKDAGGSESHQTYKNYANKIKNKKEELEEALKAERSMRVSGEAYQINTQSARENLTNLANTFKKVESIADRTARSIGRFILKLTGLNSASKKTKSSMASVTDIAKRLSKELTRVGKMAKLMITRMAIRAVINNVGEGFKSLAIHSQRFNESMSNIINSSKTLGYSVSSMVSPLINALAPALIKIIELVTRAVNALNQLFSALAGFGTWSKAKKFTDSWADSIKGASGAAKELKKTVLGFDELNQLQDNSSSGGGGGIADMFEDVDVAPWAKELSKKIKDIAKTLFDPIKKAWDKVGEYVKKSWKYAMDEVLQLAKSIGEDFLEVWQQEKTQKIFENILYTIGLIGVAIGNLAHQFRIAWEANDTGKKILEAIRDIILIITEHIKNMAQATAEWAANLNFEPLLTSVQAWLESLKPVFDSIMGVIEDFYNEVVLKFTKWVIESGLPALIDVFKRFNESVDWEGLREKLHKLWQHLEPFMETIGEGLIIFIERVTQKIAEFVNGEKFENFLDHLEKWMDSIEPEDVADAIEKLVTALIALKIIGIAITGLTAVAGIINGIATAVGALGAVVGVFGTFAAGLATVGKAVLIVAGIVVGGFALLKEPLLKVSEWLGGNKEKIDNLREAYSGFKGSVELCKNTYLDLWYTITGQDDKLEELHNKTIVLTNAQGEATKIVDTWGDTIIDFTHDIDDMSKSTDDASGVITIYSDAVEDASGKLPKLGDKTYEASSAQESLSKALDDLQTELKNTETAQGTYKTSLDNVKGAQEVNISISEELGKTYEVLKDEADKVTISLQDNKPAYQNAGDAAKEASGKVADYVASNDDIIQIIPDVNTSMESMQTTMDDVSKAVGDSAEALRGEFSEDKWKLDGVDKGLSSTFENALKSVKEKFKSAFEWINDKLKLDVDGKTVKLGTIGGRSFATGGFPDENGIFFANSSEMVGKFTNGKTAVANNEQIVAGIERGVFNAVTSAMATQGSNGGQYIANNIYLDGNKVATAISKSQDKQSRRYSPAY